MPAVSQKQRGYLASHFGVAWMRKHHFDNKGKLPEYSPNTPQGQRRKQLRAFARRHQKRG